MLFFLDDVEARPGRSYDVTVRFLLDQLHCLLLLQNQEAVKFGSRLLLVVVPAEIQQADGLGACLCHHPLWERWKVRMGGNKYILNEHKEDGCCVSNIKFRNTESKNRMSGAHG